MRILKKFPIHPSFLLVIFWFALTKNPLGFLTFVGVILTHELGHYFVAKKLGYKLDSFFLAPYGVSLNYKDCKFSPQDEVKIAFAGPAVNLIIAFFTVSMWWIFPISYGYTLDLATQSFLLAIFNLLPAYPMDGGRIFVGVCSNALTRKNSIKIVSIFNFVLAAIFFCLFIISCFINFNPSFMFASAFMLCGMFQGNRESKYEKLNVFKKSIKSFSKPKILLLNASVSLCEAMKHVEANKYTIFYIVGAKTKMIDEKTLLKWTLIYPIQTTFSEILKI